MEELPQEESQTCVPRDKLDHRNHFSSFRISSIFFSKIFSHLGARSAHLSVSFRIDFPCLYIVDCFRESDYFLQEFNPHRILNKYLTVSLHRISKYSAGPDWSDDVSLRLVGEAKIRWPHRIRQILPWKSVLSATGGEKWVHCSPDFRLQVPSFHSATDCESMSSFFISFHFIFPLSLFKRLGETRRSTDKLELQLGQARRMKLADCAEEIRATPFSYFFTPPDGGDLKINQVAVCPPGDDF